MLRVHKKSRGANQVNPVTYQLPLGKASEANTLCLQQLLPKANRKYQPANLLHCYSSSPPKKYYELFGDIAF